MSVLMPNTRLVTDTWGPGGRRRYRAQRASRPSVPTESVTTRELSKGDQVLNASGEVVTFEAVVVHDGFRRETLPPSTDDYFQVTVMLKRNDNNEYGQLALPTDKWKRLLQSTA
ncbi:MAG TPA: hypothetical protein VLG40_02330 [Candidatus Saccharimonas sp.]|nr:hypothetical protein [Candidatus Saccharimonas sp.]